MTGGVVGQPAHGEEPKVGVHRQQCLGQPNTAETGHTVQPNCPKLILSEAHPVTAANRKTFLVGSVPATAECISELRPRVRGRRRGAFQAPAAAGRPPAAGSRRSFSTPSSVLWRPLPGIPSRPRRKPVLGRISPAAGPRDRRRFAPYRYARCRAREPASAR